MGWLALSEERAFSRWNSFWFDRCPASRGRLRYVSTSLPWREINYIITQLTLADLVQIILMTHMHMDGQITQFNIPVNHHVFPNMFWSVRTLCWWIRKAVNQSLILQRNNQDERECERAKSITHCLDSFMTSIDISITLLEGEQTEKWWSHQQMH